MKYNEGTILIRETEDKNTGSENEIIVWNVSDLAESLYAVVTPIKLK